VRLFNVVHSDEQTLQKRKIISYSLERRRWISRFPPTLKEMPVGTCKSFEGVWAADTNAHEIVVFLVVLVCMILLYA
jgi:hypothetical protein